MKRLLRLAATTAAIAAFAPVAWAGSPQTSVVYQFKTGQPNGLSPFGNLAADAAGNLYGVTYYGPTGSFTGTIFRLQKPLVGNFPWSQTILYNFTGGTDGYQPAGLLATSDGLYGANRSGGLNYGTIFKLTPPAVAGANWTETTLYQFAGHQTGGSPSGGLIKDATGGLVGVTGTGGIRGGNCRESCGVAYELRQQQSGPATYKLLHKFTNNPDGANPFGNLAVDANGVLYGSTSRGGAGCGTVYTLTPPAAGQHKWSEQVIYSPVCGAGIASGPTLDSTGNVYVATYLGYGAVIKLTPPATGGSSWTPVTLFSFSGVSGLGSYPNSPVLIDAQGDLFGTTQEGSTTSNFGIAYELARPVSGTGPYTETVLKAFTKLDYGSSGGLLPDASGNLFGTATDSSSRHACPTCAGAVYEITGSGFATTP